MTSTRYVPFGTRVPTSLVAFQSSVLVPASETLAAQIVFTNNDRDDEIGLFMMNADGSALTRLTSRAEGFYSNGLTNPAWSPDGSQIAFENGSTVFVINPDGTGDREVVVAATPTEFLDWAPGGSRILCAVMEYLPS